MTVHILLATRKRKNEKKNQHPLTQKEQENTGLTSQIRLIAQNQTTDGEYRVYNSLSHGSIWLTYLYTRLSLTYNFKM